jgi:hypothetical protein
MAKRLNALGACCRTLTRSQVSGTERLLVREEEATKDPDRDLKFRLNLTHSCRPVEPEGCSRYRANRADQA